MKHKKLLLLLSITCVAIAAATLAVKWRAPQSTLARTALFPDLAAHVNDISEISIKGYGQNVVLKQQDNLWLLASADNYPALINKVRAAVINMADLKIVAEKTSNPEFHARLGVEGPDVPESTSLLVTMKNRAGQEMVNLIVGHLRQSSGSKPGFYVRKPESPLALLVEGSLELSAQPEDWFERELFDIPPEEIKDVTISYPDGKTFGIYKESKEQIDFKTRGLDINNESAAKIIIHRISVGLEEMRADGVSSLRNFTFPEDAIITRVHTFDGLTVEAKLTRRDGKFYAHFTFTGDATNPPEKTTTGEDSATPAESQPAATAPDQQPAPAELAAMMTNALSGWVYQIPDFKYEALTSNPEQLKNPFAADREE